MKKIKTGLISLLIPIISIAQISNEKTEKVANKIQRNAKNEISFYKSTAKEKSYTNQTAFFEEIVLKSNNDEFRLIKKGKTKEGNFEEYHQFYHGIPVKNGVFVLHRTSGNIKSANGNYIRIGDLNPTPSISKNDVKAIWCNYLKIPESEVTRFKTKLLVVDALEQAENSNKSQPVLAYKIRLYSKHPLNILIGFVDARSGKVCLTEPLALTSSLPKINVNVGDVLNPMLYPVPIPPPATGTFATRYSSSQNATTRNIYQIELREYNNKTGNFRIAKYLIDSLLHEKFYASDGSYLPVTFEYLFNDKNDKMYLTFTNIIGTYKDLNYKRIK